MRLEGVRGWLALLCVLLLVWQPISLGLVASSVLDALPARGAPLAALLSVRVLVTVSVLVPDCEVPSYVDVVGLAPSRPYRSRSGLQLNSPQDWLDLRSSFNEL